MSHIEALGQLTHLTVLQGRGRTDRQRDRRETQLNERWACQGRVVFPACNRCRSIMATRRVVLATGMPKYTKDTKFNCKECFYPNKCRNNVSSRNNTTANRQQHRAEQGTRKDSSYSLDCHKKQLGLSERYLRTAVSRSPKPRNQKYNAIKHKQSASVLSEWRINTL